MEAIELAANKFDYANIRLPSGAGHDAVYVSPLGPTGMVFIPCLNGRSHCPEEWIESQQLWRGTQALTELDGILISPGRSLLSSG